MIRRGTFHSATGLEQSVYRWLAAWSYNEQEGNGLSQRQPATAFSRTCRDVLQLTLEGTRELMREAIEMHIELMREHGEPVPEPTTVFEQVEVAA